MSQENVESLRRAVDAFNRGDIDAMLQEFDPDVEWHPAMQVFLEGETAAVYRGHAGVRAMLQDFDDAFDEMRIEASEFRDLGERVVAIGRLRTYGKESGARIESPWACLYEVRNAKAIWIRTYLDPKEAVEAAGLSE